MRNMLTVIIRPLLVSICVGLLGFAYQHYISLDIEYMSYCESINYDDIECDSYNPNHEEYIPQLTEMAWVLRILMFLEIFIPAFIACFTVSIWDYLRPHNVKST